MPQGNKPDEAKERLDKAAKEVDLDEEFTITRPSLHELAERTAGKIKQRRLEEARREH